MTAPLLVTGGSGLLGQAVRRLRPDAVYLSRQDGDLRDRSVAERLLQYIQPGQILHLAGVVGGVKANAVDNARFLEENMLINTAVLSAARQLRIPRLTTMLSSCAFPFYADRQTTETDLLSASPYDGNAGYAYAKRMLDLHVRLAATEAGLAWNSLTPVTMYGPHDSFDLGYAPLLGVYGVSWLTALSAGLLAWAMSTEGRARWLGPLLLALLWFGGTQLKRIEWTQIAGSPLRVSLSQGNIPQEQKFDPELRGRAFRIYTELVAASRGKLVVLPESAFPVFAEEVPQETVATLARIMRERGGDVLVGGFIARPPEAGETQARLHNSVVSLGASDTQLYRKRHLVPFGEFIPPGFGWVLSVLKIPLTDFARGETTQPPILAGGTRWAVAICYEDIFGEEVIDALPAAGVLLNVSNDAWFGESLAADQHLQFSQMRALETGR